MRRMLLPVSALLAAVLACSSSAATTSGPRATARSTGGGGSTTTQTVSSGASTRTYLLHRPASAPVGRTVPAVVVLHGAGASAAKIRSLTRFDAVGDTRGWLVAYPEAQPNPDHWQEGCCGTFELGPQDVLFMSDLVDALVRQGADPRQVYIAGFSSGGLLAYRLACQLSGKITAVASVSGTQRVPLEVCRPSRPVSLIEIHGTADYYQGTCGNRTQTNDSCVRGTGNYSPGVQELNAEWRTRNGCAAPRVATAGKVTTSVAGGCAQGTAVELVTVTGGGHCWQGGVGQPTACQQVDATSTIAAFFAGRAA